MNGRFLINRRDAKVMGVAAGLADYTGIDPLIIRLGLVGLTPTQLADYAAMRSFVRTDPAKLAGSPAPSILKIIDAPADAAVPVTLTQWDLSFLKGVYASTANAYSASQRSEIRRSMGRDLGAGDAQPD